MRRKTTYQLTFTIEGTPQAQRVVVDAIEKAVVGVIYNSAKVDQLIDTGRISVIEYEVRQNRELVDG